MTVRIRRQRGIREYRKGIRMRGNIKKGWIWILLAILGVSALSGCRKDPGPDKPEESKQESKGEESGKEDSDLPDPPREGGTLSMAVVNPDSLNPLLCEDEAGRQMLNLIFSPLVEINEQGEALPCIAKSWNWDGNRLTIQINTDIHYHDGTTVTAADVVYSIGIIQQAEQSPYKECMEGIQQVQATATDTVVLTFQYGGETQLVKLRFPVLSRAYYSRAKADALPMGSGPYRVDRHWRSRELQLVRNEEYFGNRPYIDNITVYLTHVTDSVSSAFESGKTDMFAPEEMAWGVYENREGLTLHTYASGEGVQVIFNMQSQRLTQADQRQGIALCIDSADLLKDIYRDHGTVTENVLWPETESVISLGYDPQKGKDLLKEATKETVVLAVFKEDELTGSCAQMMAAELIKEGLKIELKEIDENMQWQKESWDLLMIRRHNTALQLSKQLGTEQSENYGSYHSEPLDRFLQEQLWETNANQQLSEYLSQDWPLYPLFSLEKAVMTGKNVGGRLVPTAWNWYRGIENLYIKEKEK